MSPRVCYAFGSIGRFSCNALISPMKTKDEVVEMLELSLADVALVSDGVFRRGIQVPTVQ